MVVVRGDVVSGGIDTTVADTHVAGPVNMLAAPFASGFFVGDYEGLTAVGASFDPFFVQVNAACVRRRCRRPVWPTGPMCLPAALALRGLGGRASRSPPSESRRMA